MITVNIQQIKLVLFGIYYVSQNINEIDFASIVILIQYARKAEQMEQHIFRLPEIRISELQRIISERKPKVLPNSKSCTIQLSPALVSGYRPYYVHREQTFRTDKSCGCHHNKCECKNISKNNINGQKFKYLHKKEVHNSSIPHNARFRYKTEANQKQPLQTWWESKSHTKGVSHLQQYTKDELLKQNWRNKNISKMQLWKLLENKYQSLFQNTEFKQRIKAFVDEFARQQNKNGNIKNLRNLEKLFKKFQTSFSRELLCSNSKSHLRSMKKQTINKQIYKQKKIIKAQKVMTEQASRTQSQLKSQNKESAVNEQNESALDFINLLFYRDNEKLNEKFMSNFVNADIQNFKSKIQQIKKVIRQYSNQQRVQRTIRLLLTQLQHKIQQKQMPEFQKVLKKQHISSLFRLQQDWLKKKQEPEANEYKKIKRTKMPIKKSEKTIKFIKDYKDMNSLTVPDSCNEIVSATSLTSCLNNSQTKKRLSVSYTLLDDTIPLKIVLPQQKEKTVTFIENSCQKRNYEQELKLSEQILQAKQNIDQAQQTEMNDDMKKTVRYFIELMKGRSKPRSHKKLIQKLLLFSQIHATKQEVDQTGEAYPKSTHSQFRIQKEAEMRALEERYRNQQMCIKQFIAQNKETVNKAVTKLKKINMQYLIIDQHDSILTKKIKIRKLKQIAENSISGSESKTQMIAQVLAYVDLYNIECQLIMRRDKKINQSAYLSEFDKQHPRDLITNNMLMQDFKFISFSKDYFYGEQEENQIIYETKRIYQLQLIDEKSKVNEKLNLRNVEKEQKDVKCSNDQDLIQKQLSWVGHCENLNLKQSNFESGCPNKMKNCVSQIRLERGIRLNKKLWTKQRGESKFLLTQNTKIFDTSSITQAVK